MRLSLVLVLLAACSRATQPESLAPTHTTPHEDPPVAKATSSAAPKPPAPRAIDLAMGGALACARFEDGATRCWGDASIASIADRPAQIAPSTRAEPDPATHACARFEGGAVRCFGSAQWGALAAPPSGALEIASGGGRSCARDATGVVCWGASFATPLAPLVARAEPWRVAGLDVVEQIAVGGDHACAISQGAVRCWGANLYGQLGDGTTIDRAAPVLVKDLADARRIALGARHSCALAPGGVVCWGDDEEGQLGIAGTSRARAPHRAPAARVPGTETATAIAAGDAHACALLASGEVVCWGSARACGAGAEPQRVPGIDHATAIAAGADASCAIRASGDVVCWGGPSSTVAASCTPSTMSR